MIAPRLDVSWILRQRPLQGVKRRGASAEPAQRARSDVVGLNAIVVRLQGQVRAVQRVGRAFQREQHEGFLSQRRGVPRPQALGRLEALERLRELLLPREHRAAAQPRLHHLGRHGERAFERVRGLVELAALGQSEAKIHVRDGVTRIEAQRLAIARDGLGPVAELHQCLTEIVMGPRAAGLDPDGGSQRIRSRGRPAGREQRRREPPLRGGILRTKMRELL